MRVGAVLVLLLLAGCGTTGSRAPQIQTVQIDVPVPVSCVPADLPPAPDYPDTRQTLMSTDGPGRYAKLAAGWALRDARLGALEAVVTACRKAAPPE
jgi:hypothetical protein